MSSQSARGRRDRGRSRQSGGWFVGMVIALGVLFVAALAGGAWLLWPGRDRSTRGLPAYRSFTPAGGEFTIDLPGEPKEMAPPGADDTPNARSYVTSPTSDVAFIVQVTDLPAAPLGVSLARPYQLQLRNGGKMVGGVPWSDEAVMYRGFPGRQFVCRNAQTGKAVVIRMLVAQTDRGMRAYSVGAVGPNYGAEVEAVRRMMDSLEIKGARPPDRTPHFGDFMHVVVVGPKANGGYHAVAKSIQGRLSPQMGGSWGVMAFPRGDDVHLEAEPVRDPAAFTEGWDVGRIEHRGGRVIHVRLE